jgi:hypothetical protein
MHPSIRFLKQRGLTQPEKKEEAPPPPEVIVKEDGIIATRLQPLRFKKK